MNKWFTRSVGVVSILFAIALLFCVTPAHADDLYTVANAKGDINQPAGFFSPGYKIVNFDHDTNGTPLPFATETNNPLDPNLYSAWGVTFSTESTLYIASSNQTPGSAVDYAQNSPPNSLFSWKSYRGPNGPNYALFSANQLPTAVGIDFTDGTEGDPFYIQAYDKSGSLIPGSKVSIDYADNTYYTSFGEDAFVGIAYRDGISKLEWGSKFPRYGGLEVDNLMFGQSAQHVVPEPASMLLFGLGGGVLALFRRKRS